MRDLLLSAVVVALLAMTIRRAEIGAYLWAWLSLMNPHKMTWGFAFSMPWAQLAAVVTLGSFLFSKSRKPLPINGGIVALLMLWGWTTVTALASINNPGAVWERWIFASKIFFMLFITLMLLRERKQIDILVWVVAFSIAFFGIKGGAYTIATGGSGRVWGPPGGMLEENNALAVALIIVLPLVYYLRHTNSNRWLRYSLSVCMLLMGASVLGSQSRGALLALFAMAVMLGLKGRHPFRFSLMVLAALAIGVAFMPDSWSSRMDTIQNYQGDTSAMSRIYTWHTLWNVAVDRPLVGSGFRADNLSLFLRYGPIAEQYDLFVGKYWVAHSIYFQALGEHGFVGLVLFLSIWAWVWFASGRLAKQAEAFDDLKDWAPLLLRMCQVATVGYLAGGAFLSLMLLDLPYYLLGIVTLVKCAITDRQRALSRAGPLPQAANRPASVVNARTPGLGGLR